MKKFLIMGIAALAFISCSKDAIESATAPAGYQNDAAIANYANAFKATFGVPDPNQTWGFGDPVNNTNARMFGRRAIQPTYEFPSDADASKFLAEVPEGVEKLTENVGIANHWIDETWTDAINIWSSAGGSKLYIKGNCDFSNRSFYFGGNSELYLLEGATLTLSAANAADLQTNTMIYVAPHAKIVTPSVLHLNNGLHIYNHGTIEANSLSTNSNSLLYNVGTVTITTAISVENTLATIVNDGTITAEWFNTAGSGKFLNNADVTIEKTTYVSSNENTWVNNGQYHTGYFLYHAGSDEVINNCKLTVDEDFNICFGSTSTGSFKMDSGSGVVCKNFNGGGNYSCPYYRSDWGAADTATGYGGPFYIHMGGGSVFKVTETATMNASVPGSDYGIYGPTSGTYAVFQAKNIVAGKANQGYSVTYGNNLYIYAEQSHFENGMSGAYPFIYFKGGASEANIYAPEFVSGKPGITITPSTCNPGFSGGGIVPPANTPSLHVMAEDLSVSDASDFDFNDCVIDVFYVDANTVTIKLLAAGGTLPLRINEDDNWEVHKLFDVDVTCMVNTGTKYHTAHAPYSQVDGKAAVELTLTGKTWSSDQNTFAAQVNSQVKLEVYKDNRWIELTAEQGQPACKIATSVNIYMKDYDWYPEEYRWPWEKQNIGELFLHYVQHPTEQWYITK